MLTGKQRGYLTRLAATMDPTIMIGKNGSSQEFEQAFAEEFTRRELVKLRFISSKDERFTLARNLAEKYKAELVRIIGNTAVFYRQAEDPEKRTITLP